MPTPPHLVQPPSFRSPDLHESVDCVVKRHALSTGAAGEEGKGGVFREKACIDWHGAQWEFKRNSPREKNSSETTFSHWKSPVMQNAFGALPLSLSTPPPPLTLVHTHTHTHTFSISLSTSIGASSSINGAPPSTQTPAYGRGRCTRVPARTPPSVGPGLRREVMYFGPLGSSSSHHRRTLELVLQKGPASFRIT